MNETTVNTESGDAFDFIALERARFNAKQDYKDLQDVISREKARMVSDCIEKITAMLSAKYSEKVDLLAEELKQAQERYDYAKIKAAAANTQFPVGTRVQECKPPHRLSDHLKQGRKGVIELYDYSTARDWKESFTTLSLGDLFVRVLKKDGSPSKSVYRLWNGGTRALPYGWKLEQTASGNPEGDS